MVSLYTHFDKLQCLLTVAKIRFNDHFFASIQQVTNENLFITILADRIYFLCNRRQTRRR